MMMFPINDLQEGPAEPRALRAWTGDAPLFQERVGHSTITSGRCSRFFTIEHSAKVFEKRAAPAQR